MLRRDEEVAEWVYLAGMFGDCHCTTEPRERDSNAICDRVHPRVVPNTYALVREYVFSDCNLHANRTHPNGIVRDRLTMLFAVPVVAQ